MLDPTQLVAKAKGLQDQIVTWRRRFHEIPELGLDLPKTSALVTQELTAMNIDIKTGLAQSGIVGLIRGNKDGPTFALRADMDALPVSEETGLPFASQHPGYMHACGHDAHMAMLLGAARLLVDHRYELSGNVKLLFQPGEESPGGAAPMIAAGALDNPKVEAILGLHIGALFKDMPAGTIGIGYGPLMASLDRFHIKVIGRGGHGAMPEGTVDPIVITGVLIGALQQLVSREQKPTHPLVLAIGRLQGGRTYNVIPGFVELEGTVRATFEEERQRISKRMENIVAGVTSGLQGSYEFRYDFGYPPLVTDQAVTKQVEDTAHQLFGPDAIVKLTEPSMGGEDMAYYLEQVPGTFVFLSSANPAKGIVPIHHSSKFQIDEDVLWKGAALMAASALNWLSKRNSE